MSEKHINKDQFKYGFRMVGGKAAQRRLTIADKVFKLYCGLDHQLQFKSDSYLSCFTFDREFKKHLIDNGTTKGFDGKCYSPYLWFDIDNADLKIAQHQAKQLVNYLADCRYKDKNTLIFFSGSKGFCIGIPTQSFHCEPSQNFNQQIRELASLIVKEASELMKAEIIIDLEIYKKVQPLRAPNTRHAKTGLHKINLSATELFTKSIGDIKELAKQPRKFDCTRKIELNYKLAGMWSDLLRYQETQVQIVATHTPSTTKLASDENEPRTNLNQSTIDFIKHSAKPGEHRLIKIFQSAANLAEFSSMRDLIYALLKQPAEATGKPLRDIYRQIDCGINHGKGGANANTDTP